MKNPIKEFKKKQELRRMLLAKLVNAFKRPITEGEFSYSPTEQEIKDYQKEISKLNYKKLLELDGLKKFKLKLDVLDRLKSIRKKKYAVVTIFNDNQTTDTGVCYIYNRSFKRSGMRYLLMSERGIMDPEFKMLHFYYYANRPFPIQFRKMDDYPQDMPDGKLLDSTIEMSVIEALANLDMSGLIKICLVASCLTFIVSVFLLVLQLRGGL